jgi:nucleotide-binding universal stress UspA family protein
MVSEPIGPVVVGVDGSPASLEVVELAAEEAAARVTPLIIVHAHAGTSGRSVTELLETAVAEARSEHPGLAVSSESVTGAPVDVLLERAVDASLVVVGHRGHCGRDAAVGSVAMGVISASVTPVLVHRRLDPIPDIELPRPVLVALAPAAPADDVLELGFIEASLRGTALHAVSALPERVSDDQPYVAALQRWSEKFPEVRVTRTVRHGVDIAVALTAASRTAQLAVVGRRERGPLLPIGSIAHVLVHRAGCPVAVVGTD